jgi:serine/threonine protein kinase
VDPRPHLTDTAGSTGSWPRPERPTPGGAGAAEAAGSTSQSPDPPTVLSKSSSLKPGVGSEPALPLPAPGDRIDSFLLREPIGSGGMGAVFLAEDTSLERVVALKVLPPAQARDPDVVMRFYQEGRACARLDHENIAQVYTIGHDSRFHYIAFEFIAGKTLRQLVDERGSLSVAEAINYTLQIAAALVHAVSRGVVHRDIKPSNIIVTPQGRAKLVDMGLARHFERGRDMSDGLTQSHMTLGTFDYISPEQARDPRSVDVRSDLYSLGCTLFHVLTGRPPFPSGTVLQKLLQHQEEQPPDPRTLNPSIPAGLSTIVMRLMAKDPARRPQTPEILVRDLLALAGSLGVRSVSPEGLVWLESERPAWEKHLVWAVPTVILGIVLATIASLAGHEDQDPDPLAAGNKAVANAKPSGAGSIPAPTVAAPAPSPAIASAPREVRVLAQDDLWAKLKDAPAGKTTFILNDVGPYRLKPTGNGTLDLAGREFEIRGDVSRAEARGGTDPQQRPRLQLAEGVGAANRVPALLEARGGRLTLEGLDLMVDPRRDVDDWSAVVARGSELTVRNCTFSRPESRADLGRWTALRLVESGTAGGAPLAQVVGSHFGPNLVAIRAEGPAALSVRNSIFQGSDPAFWLDNPRGDSAAVASGSASPLRARLELSHLTILAGRDVVFQSEGIPPEIRAEDTAIGGSPDGDPSGFVLASAAEPDGLIWRGRRNLYGKVRSYLMPARGVPGRGVQDYPAWAHPDSAADRAEFGTAAAGQPLWVPPPTWNPNKLAPPESLRLVAAPKGDNGRPLPIGASQTPVGAIPTPAKVLAERPSASEGAAAEKAPSPAAARVQPTPTSLTQNNPTTATSTDDRVLPEPPRAADTTPESSPPGAEVAEPAASNERMLISPRPMLDMQPMGGGAVGPDDEPTGPEASATPTADAAKAVASNDIAANERREPRPPAPAESTNVAGPASAAEIQTARQFVTALQALGPEGGTLRLAPGANLSLTSQVIPRGSSVVVQAQPDASGRRPRIKFQPPPPFFAAFVPSAPTPLFHVRGGQLELQGIDLTFLSEDNSSRRMLFSLTPGSKLTLKGCSVTVEGQDWNSMIELEGDDEQRPGDSGGGGMGLPIVRIEDSLLRGGGDAISITGRTGGDLTLKNAVVSTGGGLLHALGLGEGGDAGPAKIKLTLDQVTGLFAEGLVRLQTSAKRPIPPEARITARNSVFSTGYEEPLLRIEGQQELRQLRDLLRWEGDHVGYHNVDIYRRDESMNAQEHERDIDRSGWSAAVAKDDNPIHGQLLQNSWPEGRSYWTLRPSDAALTPESRDLGPDLARIPDPDQSK